MAETLILQLGGAARADDLREVVPTLYIGLGGSGKEVLMRLRKRFYDRYTLRSTSFTRFLAIDTDEQPFTPQGESPEAYAPVEFQADEMVGCQIDDRAFHGVFSGLRKVQDPRYLPWLKPEMERHGPQACLSGAGTHRPYGRMAFFIKYKSIYEQLLFHLKAAVAQPRIEPSLGEDVRVDTNRLEVVIVTSLAGGTGSGMFIDVAYLVRQILNEQVTFGNLRSKSITLIAFLPWMFKEKAGVLFERFKQNTYAALLEMEKYGTPRSGDEMFLGRAQQNGQAGDRGYGVSFDVHWNGNPQEFVERRGWDTCYLIDNVNNFTLTNPLPAREVYQMAADYLWLDFGSNTFSVTKRSARCNLVQFLDRIKIRRVRKLDANPRGQPAAPTLQAADNVLFEGHNGCTFSSFGLSEVAIDTGRVQRAAAYRLAQRLVKDHWLRDPVQVGRVGQGAFSEWSKQDLMNGRQLNAGGPAPSFHPDDLARMLLKHQNVDWTQRIEQELAQAGAGEPASVWNSLNQVAQAQQKLLAPAKAGGEAGQAWQAMQENFNKLVNTPGMPGPLRERLERLAEDRVAALGVSMTLKLLEVYHKTFEQVSTAARKSREAGSPGKLARPQSLARLEEARRLPGFVRATAVKIEQSRAQRELDQARRTAAEHSQRAFQAAAAEFVEQIAQRMKQYVGIGGAGAALDETLHSYYRKIDKFLGDLGQRLNDRFDFTKKETSSERRVMLLPKWQAEDYDLQLNRVLVERPEIGPAEPLHGGVDLGPLPPFTLNWEKLSRLVIQEIKSTRPAEMANIDNLSDLLNYWMKHQENVTDGVSRVAELVHNACYSVLRANEEGGVKLDQFAKGSIIDLLMKNQEYSASRRDYVTKLVHGSACYLPTVDEQRLNPEFMPAFRNIYGQAASSEPSGEQNAAALKAEVDSATRAQGFGDQYTIGDHKVGTVPSLVLCREMAGLPLHDYAQLQELFKAYDAQPVPRDECHLTFRETWEDLPDIRQLSNDDYSEISRNVDNVLQALVLNIIVFENDAYYVRVPMDIAMAEYRLGTRLDRIIKHACEKAQVRSYLAQRVQNWRKEADAARWAVLYAALLRTFFDTKGNQYAADLTNAAPPLQNCVRNLIRQAGEHLQAAPGGKELHDRLRPAFDNEPDYERRNQRQQQSLAGVVSRCLQRISPTLPVYRITSSDLSFLTAEDPQAPA